MKVAAVAVAEEIASEMLALRFAATCLDLEIVPAAFRLPFSFVASGEARSIAGRSLPD